MSQITTKPTKAQLTRSAKLDRLAAANELIGVIAENGRKFFRYQDRVAYLELDSRGRVWHVDAYSQKRIYTHSNHRWLGFSNGGTLRGVIERLRDFVTKGDMVQPYVFGGDPSVKNHWGYGDDIRIVFEAACRLGITFDDRPINITDGMDSVEYVRMGRDDDE